MTVRDYATCGAVRCGRPALHPLNFCDLCWVQLPPDLMAALRKARGRGLRNQNHPTPEYRDLYARAQRALEGAA